MPGPHTAFADATLHAADLQRFTAHLLLRIQKQIAGLENDLRFAARGFDLGSIDNGRVRNVQAARFARRAREMTDLRMARISEILHTELHALAEYEITYSSGLIKRTLEGLEKVPAVKVPPGIRKAIVKQSTSQISLGNAGIANLDSWVKQTTGSLKTKMARQIAASTRLREPGSLLAQRLTGTGNIRGISLTTRNELRALTRTAVTSASSITRSAVMRRNRRAVMGVQQVSILDGRTSNICLAYSGKKWRRTPKGFMRAVGHRLPYLSGTPRHYGCRSYEIPWFRSAHGMRAGKKGDAGAFTGEPPPPPSLSQLLRDRGPAYQNDLLGPGRGALYRAGRIDVDHLIDFSGQPRNLTTIRRLARRRELARIKRGG